MRTFGLCSVTFRKQNVAEIIQLAKENGLSVIEWGSDVHVPQTDLGNAERAGEMTSSAGLSCPSYGTYFRCGEGENFENYARAAEKLGANTLRIWAGEKDAKFWTEEEYSRFVERVRGYCDLAKERGQTLAFEYHHGTFNNCAANSLRLLSDVGRDNLKTYWQPMYWGKFRGEQAEENDLASLRALRGKIANVHVYHWIGSEKRPLFEGEAAWKKYVAEIGPANYYLEFVKDDDPLQFERDAKTLLSWK